MFRYEGTLSHRMGSDPRRKEGVAPNGMQDISKREATGNLRRQGLCNTPEHCDDLICSQIDLRNREYRYGALPLHHQRATVTVPPLGPSVGL